MWLDTLAKAKRSVPGQGDDPVRYQKALVTGGAGFIGSHMVERLLQEGLEVISIDNLATGRPTNMFSGAKYHTLDLRSDSLTRLLADENPEVVFHMAAQSSVTRSVRDPREDAEINVVGSTNLLEACRQSGVDWLVYSCTGGALYGNPDQLPCDENHSVRPLSPYGASKFAFEAYLECYRQVFGLKSSTLRYSNVYGPRQDPHGEAGVVAIFTSNLLSGKQATIFGDGLQERDFVYVEDVIDANLAVVDKQVQDTFNIGVGVPTNINTIHETLAQITGAHKPAKRAQARAGETYKIYLDVTKAQQVLGWSPKVSLPVGLNRVVAHARTEFDPNS